jgi:hypothetical protein
VCELGVGKRAGGVKAGELREMRDGGLATVTAGSSAAALSTAASAVERLAASSRLAWLLAAATVRACSP